MTDGGAAPLEWHDPALQDLADLTAPTLDVGALRAHLHARGMFAVHQFPTGLRPAVVLPNGEPHPSYRFAWLRDNLYLALADLRSGRLEPAERTVRAWIEVYLRHAASARGDDIEGLLPVKVDGATGAAPPGGWPQAQHDALGLLAWSVARFVGEEALVPDEPVLTVLDMVYRHLTAVQYWAAADSGHWEEERRRNSSSVGCVVAGAEAWRSVAATHGLPETFDDQFVARGRDALASMLPWETPPDDARPRRHDAALLFLVEPLQVITGDAADEIVDDLVDALGEAIGIVRYRGDSYWAPDYRDKVDPDARAADYSGRIDERNVISQPRLEAQWTLFDPWVSIAHGVAFRRTGDPSRLAGQRLHLHRTLAAITGPDTPVRGRLPEAWFLERGRWVPNDQVPLLWAEASLEIALLELDANQTVDTSSPVG